MRRYSNQPDPANPLVRTLQLVDAQPSQTSVVPAAGSGAPSMVGRAAIDPDNLAASYLTGSTLVELAECHGVSASTIKRVLRELGTRKYRNSFKPRLMQSRANS